MRVISGELRGLKLTAPDGEDTRPTLDRVKEAVFSMLMPYLMGASVLDLFAGSGAMGIEALSRGAKQSVFVDNNKAAIECITQNVTAARAETRSIVQKCDAISFINNCDSKFDLIFLDPPYNSRALYSSSISEILKRNLLNDNGLIIAEWDFTIGFPAIPEGFVTFKEKKYGRVCITVLKRG